MNLSYTHSSWGQRYADVVTVPIQFSRPLVMHVRAGAVKSEPWHYDVYDEHGAHLGAFTWYQGRPNHEFWALVAQAAAGGQ